MTIHKKALEAAHTAYQNNDNYMNEHSLSVACKQYLTTLLDSPEMVEKLAIELFGSSGIGTSYWDMANKPAYRDKIKAVIAAIKKEAGI